MGYYCEDFIYDGVSASSLGLEVYDVDNTTQGSTEFHTHEIVSEEVPLRWRPIFFGVKASEPLKITISFGVIQERIDEYVPLDRLEMEEIANWLTTSDNYRWLEIVQDDMTHRRFKAICTKLEEVGDEGLHFAFEAEFTCDSPFSYASESAYVVEATDAGTAITIPNTSSLALPYLPVVNIAFTGGGSVSITNTSDNDRTMSFTDVPGSVKEIKVNCDTGIITNDQELNAYEYFNMKFLRLVRGDNNLVVKGSGQVEIVCEFPMNTGS